MEIKDLVKSRRTIHQFKPEPVPDEVKVRAAMEQAIWAPNHYLTQPWRFYLLGEKSKNQICLLNAELVHEKRVKERLRSSSNAGVKSPAGWSSPA